MKGRDYGLPDYNTARYELGFEPLTTFEDFFIINPELNKTEHGRKVSHSFLQWHSLESLDGKLCIESGTF